MRTRFPLAVSALLALFVPSGVRAANLFQPLYDLDDLPLMKPGVRTFQVSSHERNGGNQDWGHFVRESGRTRVLADLEGPGVVRRIWSANPSGRLRIVIDGAAQPVVDAPFQDLFQDRVPGFRSPVAGRSSGGWYSYVPIAFRSSCLITMTDGDPIYYQVTWQKLTSGRDLTPFGGTFSSADQTAYDAAVLAWNRLGEAPRDRRAVALPRRAVNLPPGGKWAQPVKGPGTITELRFQWAAGVPFARLRQTILRISFDGDRPSVEAPLADFLGIGFDGAQWKSLALGAQKNSAYCYFRMPFRRTARIELENQGRSAVNVTFQGTARPGVPSTPWGYFHANYHTAINVPGQDYMMGRLRGAGHVVGVTHSMRGLAGLWFLEGDERIFVDGEAQPGIYGTGTEDYYNCGWYFNTGPVNVATHGASHKTDNEIGAWRMHLPDPIPFASSLDFRIEHGGTNDAPGSEYASVIYWYGTLAAQDVSARVPRGAALLPRPFVPPIENAIQGESAVWTTDAGASVRRQGWHEVSPYRGDGRALIKGQPGGTASLPLEVRFPDLYDIDLYLSGAGTTSKVQVKVDGEPVGDALTDTTNALPVRKVSLEAVSLSEGRHALQFSIVSGMGIGVDAIRVTPRSRLVKDFAVLGPFSVDSAVGVNANLPPDGKAPMLGQGYVTDGRTVKWTVMRAPSGMLDLGATLSPNENAVAYAAFAVRSPRAQTLPLMVGSDDGVAVWVNGKRVYSIRVPRGFQLDQDRVEAPLNEGWNTVVLKVDQGAAAWSVSARFLDPHGTLELAAVPTAR